MREWLSGRALPCLIEMEETNFEEKVFLNSFTLAWRKVSQDINKKYNTYYAGVAQW